MVSKIRSINVICSAVVKCAQVQHVDPWVLLREGFDVHPVELFTEALSEDNLTVYRCMKHLAEHYTEDYANVGWVDRVQASIAHRPYALICLALSDTFSDDYQIASLCYEVLSNPKTDELINNSSNCNIGNLKALGAEYLEYCYSRSLAIL